MSSLHVLLVSTCRNVHVSLSGGVSVQRPVQGVFSPRSQWHHHPGNTYLKQVVQKMNNLLVDNTHGAQFYKPSII